MWTHISDPIASREIKHFNTVKYCKKGGLKFNGADVNTEFMRFKLWIFLAIHDHEEFEKIVIGTFGRIDAPLSPSDKGGVALTRYLSGVNTERMQRRRDELLTATLADIRALADWFEALNENALICVHGSAEKVNEAAGLFDRIEVLAGAGGDDDDDEDDDDEDDFCK